MHLRCLKYTNRMLPSYVEEAQNLLGNCKMASFLQAKLKRLESDVEQKCGKAISSSLPSVSVLHFCVRFASDFCQGLTS